jgi:hypothetical protein
MTTPRRVRRMNAQKETGITMKKLIGCACVLLGLFLFSVTAQAQNFIINGFFNSNANGWMLSTTGCNGTSYINNVGNPPGSVLLNNCGEANSDPTAAQTVTGLTPGASYMLSVDVRLQTIGSNGGASANSKSFGVFLDLEPNSPIFLGEFLDNAWHTVITSFKAAASSHTIIFAAELDTRTPGVASNSDVSYYIDNVSLTPGLDPCCPPWNPDIMLQQLQLTQAAPNVLGNITYSFLNSPQYANMMQTYIDYLHSINSSIKNIILDWNIVDCGPSGVAPSPCSNVPVGPSVFTEWSCTKCPSSYPPSQLLGGGGFLTNSFGKVPVVVPVVLSAPLPVNRWYQLSTFMYLNDGITFWPDKCSGAAVYLTVYEGPAALMRVPNPNRRIAVEVREPGATRGHVVMLPFSRDEQ